MHEVDARENLVHCPHVHLMKPAAGVHMISVGTVVQIDNFDSFS